MARAAGVSVATVSRALRGLDRVSPATRERVLRVAADLDYMASPTATSLASGRTKVVAVVAPFFGRWFFATLVSAVEKTLRPHGYHVMLFDLEEDNDGRLELHQSMFWKRVDGVINLTVPLTDDEMELLDKLHLPVVAVGTELPGRSIVSIDDGDAVAQATEHVVSLGHTKIGYIGSVPSNVAHRAIPMQRFSSFTNVMTSHGLAINDDWILRSDWNAEAARLQAADVLAAAERPTAFIAASDEMAIGVREAALAQGLNVPGDLSIVGIDDFELSATIGLTTIRQDVAAQGREAAEMFLKQLVDPDARHSVILPTELIVRSTTAPPPELSA